MTFAQFYTELEHQLPQSTGADREKWAEVILENNFKILELSKLIESDTKVASRFLWLLTGLGMLHAPTLFQALPYLWEQSRHVTHVDMKKSFANYWRFCGVPAENEAEAIDLLFHWLQSAETNVTIKSRALFVLYDLTAKYPELKNELQLCIKDQLQKNTNDFDQRALKILRKLDA
jgi:hypothetical protein